MSLSYRERLFRSWLPGDTERDEAENAFLERLQQQEDSYIDRYGCLDYEPSEEWTDEEVLEERLLLLHEMQELEESDSEWYD